MERERTMKDDREGALIAEVRSTFAEPSGSARKHNAPLRVLCVDRDGAAAAIRESLSPYEIEVTIANDGPTAVTRLEKTCFDLVLFDVGIRVSGGSFCSAVRMRSAVPIIALGANADCDLCVRALEEGADQFLPEPYELRELVARIHALVRRVRGELVPRARRRLRGGLVVDIANRSVEVKRSPISVSSTELAVLAALAQRPGEPVDRVQLRQAILGNVCVRSIDAVICHLRRKLEENPQSPRLIKTVRGVGYVLALAPA